MNDAGLVTDAASEPVGVFDSGLGGLTVVMRLLQLLPNERIIYVADQAHVPYGGRDLNEVRGFACGISDALLQQGCKAVVMACNISTATALSTVQEAYPDIPILGVIGPGAQAAVLRTRNGRIGVLATEGTVRSGAYTRTLTALNPALSVTETACPAFVPLIEAECFDEAAAMQAAREYLAPLRQARVDTIILGCTHYPLLLPLLRSLSCDAPFADHFIDPAEQAACDLARTLSASRLLATHGDTYPHLLTSTGNVTAFAAQSARLLLTELSSVRIASAQWKNGVLTLQ